MIDIKHILVLSQAEFLERQIKPIFDGPQSGAARARLIGRRLLG